MFQRIHFDPVVALSGCVLKSLGVEGCKVYGVKVYACNYGQTYGLYTKAVKALL